MPEISVADGTVVMACDMLKDALDEAGRHNAGRLEEIHLEMGTVYQPALDRLVRSLRFMAGGTIASNARLRVKLVEGAECSVKKIVIA
jgi:Zn finger protein HypA/HybF involved in hydrogenase expression